MKRGPWCDTCPPMRDRIYHLSIRLDGPGSEQINRTHRNKHFLCLRALLWKLITHTFILQRLIEIRTQLFPHRAAFEGRCCESRQIGFPALFLGINMILAIEDLSSVAASTGTLLVLLFVTMQLPHKGHSHGVNFSICITKNTAKFIRHTCAENPHARRETRHYSLVRALVCHWSRRQGR